MAIAITATARTAISHFLVTRISPLLSEKRVSVPESYNSPSDNRKHPRICGDLWRQDWTQTCKSQDMNWYDRVSQYHSESRPSFILFTELIAFIGTMATVVGMAVLLSLLQ